MALPADHSLGHELAAIADIHRGARNLRGEEELFVQLGLGDLVVVLLFASCTVNTPVFDLASVVITLS